MESNEGLNHPADQELAAFWDSGVGGQEIAGQALAQLAIHVDSCSQCQDRLERMEPALAEYVTCLNAVHAQIPRSKGEMAALRGLTDRLGMDRLETTGERDWFPP